VSVTLKGKGVGGTVCTCPYSGVGICKHLVALLLAYVHEPQAFRVIPPLEALLAPRSQQELIALIGEMIKRNPDLVSVVELSTATQPGRPMDLETYRRQIRRTYQQAVQYLKRMKAVYKSFNAVSNWEAYLQSLRAEYRHLPTLQDEMRQARL
jgi:uncharacterized Zn finger protein